MIKKLRKENTDVFTNTFLTKYDGNTLSITIFSATGHLALAGIYTNILYYPLYISSTFNKYLSRSGIFF